MHEEPNVWVPESAIIEATAIPVEDLRRARNGRYKCDRDWRRHERRIEWHKNAAGTLLKDYGLAESLLLDKRPTVEASAPNPANSADAAATEKSPHEPVVLQVWRGPAEGIRNRAMVEAVARDQRPQKREDILRVRVGDNRRLRRGMILLARHLREDLYEAVKGPVS